MMFYLPVTDISDAIREALYQPIEKTQQKMLGDIIKENNDLYDFPYKGFRRLSYFYSVDLVGNEKYHFPELALSLEDKFQNYLSFLDEQLMNRVQQFIRKVLLLAIDENITDEGLIDLGKVLPSKLLTITKLEYTENTYVESEKLKKEWEIFNPIINRLLAMRVIL